MPTRNSSSVGASGETSAGGAVLAGVGQIAVDARSNSAAGVSPGFENATPHSIGGAIKPAGLVTGPSTNSA